MACVSSARWKTRVAERTIIAEPWVGFIHQVPRHDLKWFPDLERMLKDEYWKASAQNCLGLFVLSTYVKEYLQSAGCEIPIARILYPAEPTDRVFLVGPLLRAFSPADYQRRRVSSQFPAFLRPEGTWIYKATPGA